MSDASFKTSRNRKDSILIASAIAVSAVAIFVAVGQVMATGTSSIDEQRDGGEEAVAIARIFIMSKLQGLGIQITDEFKLHTDMVVTLDEDAKYYRVEVGILDVEGVSHNGFVEVENGKVKSAMLDGQNLA